MKLRLPVLLFAALLPVIVPARAKDAAPAPPPDGRPTLAIVIVGSLLHQDAAAITDFDRLELAFRHVAAQRKWPVRIEAERFVANLPAYGTELRIFNQPLREETLGDLTFRGWMTLTVKGRKHDLGIITYRYYPRPGEDTEDRFEKVFRGAANAAADRIESLLFPKAADPGA